MIKRGNFKLATLVGAMVVLALVLSATLPGTVKAEIPLDCRLWGPVTICGVRIDAAEITVRVLDPDTGPSWTATTYMDGGVLHYRVDIPPLAPPEPGGVDGGTVYFTVTGVTYEGNSFAANLRGPDGTWRRARSVRHPLHVGSPGDANLDGVVNTADIIRVQKIIAGQEPATPCADANQDGVINTADIVRILKIIAAGP